MSIWWVNQTRCFYAEVGNGVVQASDQTERLANRKMVEEVVVGDLFVHYAAGSVPCVST